MIIYDIISNVIGGIILTVLFFIFKEKVFRTIHLDGSWVYTQKTETTSYNPYKGMELTYLALVSISNNEILGTAEKVQEKSQKNPNKEYVGKNRIRVKINGHLGKSYTSKDKISIQIVECGEKRDSSTIHTLKVINENKLEGTFSSTIANQTGKVIWERRSS